VKVKKSLLKLFRSISVLLVVHESEQPFVGSLVVSFRTRVRNTHGFQKTVASLHKQLHISVPWVSIAGHLPDLQMFQKGTWKHELLHVILVASYQGKRERGNIVNQ